jgi:hypothetical protein
MNSIVNHLGSKGIDTGIAELGVYEGTFELAINNTFINGTSASLQLLGIDTAVGLQWVSGTVDVEPPGYYTTDDNSLYLNSKEVGFGIQIYSRTPLTRTYNFTIKYKIIYVKKQGEIAKDYFASSTAKIIIGYPTEWIKVA